MCIEVAQPYSAGNDQVFDYINGKTRSEDCKLTFHHGLFIYTSTRLGEPGNLGERQHPVLLKLRGFVSGFSPVVR